MRLKSILGCGVAVVSLAVSPAQSAVINLVDLGGVTGSASEAGFKIAALYWGNMFTNNVTINLGVGYAPLATGIIGSTGSSRNDFSVAAWEAGVNATKSNSTIDQTAVLPTLTAGGASFITNGVTNRIDDTRKIVYDNAATTSSRTLYLNTSVTKAIGGIATYDPVNNPQGLDGSVTFSSNFGFDFNSNDGIDANTFDFVGVAIHEIGHALGFVSGVDFLDVYGIRTNGGAPAGGNLGYSLNSTSIYSALDMFRYSNDPTNVAPGTGAVLDLSAGTVSGSKFFSIDGGQTALFGNTFSQGRYNGDGQQASHWKDTAGCAIGNGIMDPTFCFGQTGYVTGLDLAAYDAMGWNLSTDALTYATTSTAAIYNQYALEAGVPEPATWGMMILGFGLTGAAMRRRSVRVSFSA